MLEELVQEARVDDENLVKARTFVNEVVAQMDMSKIDFEEVVFEKCRFIDCDFTKSGFYKVDFKNCDFSNCKFIDSYWKTASVASCKGDGANFSKSHFKSVQFTGSSMNYLNTAESVWENSKLDECQFQRSFFSDVTLKKTVMENINFKGTDFYKTALKGLNLSTCNIEDVMLSEGLVEMQGAKVTMFQAAELATMLGVKVV